MPPIKRKKPLPRPTKPIKRSPLRSTAATLAENAEERLVLDAARHQAAYRDARFGLGGKCLACHLGILLNNKERGGGRATSYNHCIPRSRLQGKQHWATLHSVQNLAPACEQHHEEHDRRPEWWLPLMQQVYGYEYAEPPFAIYLTEVYQRGVKYERYT